ncbi:MAG: hypothetical protein KF726_01000 [Anaerolineae bacterium]|nr:hypothetical protein [Anaerolineae bacterium]
MLLTQVGSAQTDCLLGTPFAPMPVDHAVVLPAELTLHWQATCAESYELRINKTLVVTTAQTEFKLTPVAGETNWQVTALRSDGTRANGIVWYFVTDADGWLATPIPQPEGTRLFVPPVPSVDFSSPSLLLPLACATICGSIMLIGGIAWLLGVRAQQREERRR